MRLRVAALALALATLSACAASPEAPAVEPRSAAADAAVAAAPSEAAPRMPAAPERIATPAAARPPQPALSAAIRLELVRDPCVDRDLAAPAADDAALSVLDRSYALAPTYVPDELVPASVAGFTGSSAAKLVSAAIVEDLAAMRDAWEAAGLDIGIDSAYRSYTAQAATFDAWAAQLGAAAASLRAARPGHSEHQLGTALDVSSPGWSGRFGDWAVETAEGAWMAEHAWEYGFVMSFPAGAADETCFGYEPWHYRWIGRELAAAHRSEGKTLRTFLVERAGA